MRQGFWKSMFTTTQSWNCMRIFKTKPPTVHLWFFTPLRLFNLQLVFVSCWLWFNSDVLWDILNLDIASCFTQKPCILSGTKADILPMMQPTHWLGISSASAVSAACFRCRGFWDPPIWQICRWSDFRRIVGTASEGLSCLNPQSNFSSIIRSNWSCIGYRDYIDYMFFEVSVSI